MKYWLVTGTAGFIGSNFIDLIADRYKDDVFIGLDSFGYAGNIETSSYLEKKFINFKQFKVDIRNEKELRTIFEKFKFDFVVNFAAESHVDNSIKNPNIFIETNIIGTQNLLNLSKKFGVKRYHQVSTDEVYGDLPLDRPDLRFTEVTSIHTSSPYSASKAGADLLVMAYARTYGMDTTITRCSNNYGPFHLPEKLIPLNLTNLLEGGKFKLYGDGKNVRDWLFVKDHCDAIDVVIQNAKPGSIYNVGGNNEYDNNQIAKIIVDDLGLDFDEVVEYINDRPGHDRRYAIDATKIQTELGWFPSVTFEKGIIETINWFKTNKEWWKPIKNRLLNTPK